MVMIINIVQTAVKEEMCGVHETLSILVSRIYQINIDFKQMIINDWVDKTKIDIPYNIILETS